MGVLNVTPDSFSDGGRYLDHGSAIAHGRRLRAEGADVLDVGGESTRPRAEPVAVADELARVIPVIEALAPEGRVSVDTRKPEVAEAAIQAGATLVNDVSASLDDVVAAHPGVGWVAMHMLGDPRTMQENPTYGDVVAEVGDFLVERAERGRQAGIEEVWIDPGIGFGKTTDHNLALLAHLDRLVASGFPVVVATSRKRFLGRLLADSDGVAEVGTDDRLEGSLATAAWSFAQGAGMVRAHEVAATVAAARLAVAPTDSNDTTNGAS
jgi:dihydropteroate synthase